MTPRRRPIAPRLRAWGLGLYVAIAFGFLLLPVAVIALASLSATSYLAVPPRGVTLRWFAAVLGDREYVAAILVSLALAAAATLGSLAVGTAAAYALVRRVVPGREAVAALLMAPLVFPGVVIGVALLQFYSRLGFGSTFAGLLLAHMAITLPRVLGAGPWTAFRTVTLPIIRPGVAAGGLFSFIVSFDNVPVSIFLLAPGQMTLPVKIFTAIEYGVDPTVAAVSTMLIVATGLFLVAAERWIGFHRFV
jgi:putative spermidine/putrescine transport system permease protein